MSITLDRYSAIDSSEFLPISDSDLMHWRKQWMPEQKFNRLDSIYATEAELNKLVDVLGEMEDQTSVLLEKPALKEFELVAHEPIPSVRMTTVRFKRTVLPVNAFKDPKKDEKDGIYMEMTPYIDAYISFRDKAIIDSIMTIFSFRILNESGQELATGTSQNEFWRNADPVLNVLMGDETYFRETLRSIKLIYLALQKAMRDKPVVFTTVSERTEQISAHSDKKKHAKNKVRVVKTIRLDKDELNKYEAGNRHMTCPCWGVIGHWRNYKSGKHIWIEPYLKGKERNHPELYHSKEYQFEKEKPV